MSFGGKLMGDCESSHTSAYHHVVAHRSLPEDRWQAGNRSGFS
jgi:hypothetical protein